jgi:mRNA-degrading endonuclease toxin of MazEF toxin-antitoxin module
VRQYQIRWAELPEPIGRRPVMLLTRTPAYEYLAKVIVAEITTTRSGAFHRRFRWGGASKPGG